MSSMRSSLFRSTQSLRSLSRVHLRTSTSLYRDNTSILPPLYQLSKRYESPRRWNSSTPSGSGSGPKSSPQIEAPNPSDHSSGNGNGKQTIGQIEPRLQMTFTCTANECGHRSSHEFSKRAYTKGLVLVQCPECRSRHLIADHIGWFSESLEGGKLKTVEDLLRVKGEKIRKGRVNMDGDIEYEGDD
ncbi:uncharacterized protein IL334_005374 [Kwoniella shivajii]|uniref:DNL-type domain-containing protein n=1 Tax=Kwoniella shivajii TaxID=564305 RepID=A0ABZ1D3M6_9TREE|nr:hypothetical protein IL334_005374 [Kwoniella shivajii]